jgi:hypothetical protein
MTGLPQGRWRAPEIEDGFSFGAVDCRSRKPVWQKEKKECHNVQRNDDERRGRAWSGLSHGKLRRGTQQLKDSVRRASN